MQDDCRAGVEMWNEMKFEMMVWYEHKHTDNPSYVHNMEIYWKWKFIFGLKYLYVTFYINICLYKRTYQDSGAIQIVGGTLTFALYKSDE